MIKPVTEREVSSGAFDQSPCPTRKKIIICSTPRSGSYLLCRAMIKHGIGVPHEYFNGINASMIGPRFGLGVINSRDLEVDGPTRRAYINALLTHRTVNGIFAAKIQGGQFAQYFRIPWASNCFRALTSFIFIGRICLRKQSLFTYPC